MIGSNQDILSYNLFAYCSNNPLNFVDPTGEASIAISAFIKIYGLSLSSVALMAKLTTYATIVLPYVAWGIAIAAVAFMAYKAYKAYKVYLNSTKVRSDVKSKRPPANNKVYQLAYANSKGEIIRLSAKMTYDEAIATLRSSSLVNSLMKNHKGYWGIYTNNQAYAKALAVAFGGKGSPEVHGDGYYSHYHDAKHRFHVWYGGKIRY